MFDLWGCSSLFSSTLELGSRLTFEGAKISILFPILFYKKRYKRFLTNFKILLKFSMYIEKGNKCYSALCGESRKIKNSMYTDLHMI